VAAVEKMFELLLSLRVGREGGALSDRRQAAASSSSWAKKSRLLLGKNLFFLLGKNLVR